MQVGDRQRREVVVKALEEFLDASTAEQSVSLYDVEFSDQATLSVSALVARLDEAIGLGSDRKKLYLHLSKAIRGGATAAAPTSGARDAATQASPAGTVFGFLVRDLVERWKRRDAASLQGIAKYIGENVAELRLSSGAEQEVRAWANQPDGSSLGNTGTDVEMRRLFEHLYVWSCEWFGPVDTDRIFAEAVRSAERIPAAAEYSPRKFL